MYSKAERFQTPKINPLGPGQYDITDGAFTDVLKRRHNVLHTPNITRRGSMTAVEAAIQQQQQHNSNSNTTDEPLSARRQSLIIQSNNVTHTKSHANLHSNNSDNTTNTSKRGSKTVSRINKTQSKTLQISTSHANILRDATNQQQSNNNNNNNNKYTKQQTKTIEPMGKPLYTSYRRASVDYYTHDRPDTVANTTSSYTPHIARRASYCEPINNNNTVVQSARTHNNNKTQTRTKRYTNIKQQNVKNNTNNDTLNITITDINSNTEPRRCSQRLSSKRMRDAVNELDNSTILPSSKRISQSPYHTPSTSTSNIILPTLQFDEAVALNYNDTTYDDNNFVAMSPELLTESLAHAEEAVTSGLLLPQSAMLQSTPPPIDLRIPATERSYNNILDQSICNNDENTVASRIKEAIDRLCNDAYIHTNDIKHDNILNVLNSLHSVKLCLIDCITDQLGSYDTFVWQFKCLGLLQLTINISQHSLLVVKLNNNTASTTYIDTHRFVDVVNTMGRLFFSLNRMLCQTECRQAIQQFIQKNKR